MVQIPLSHFYIEIWLLKDATSSPNHYYVVTMYTLGNLLTKLVKLVWIDSKVESGVGIHDENVNSQSKDCPYFVLFVS